MSWLVDTLVTTGALIALVLVLRRPVARHFGPGMAYALWLLPLLRLLLPPLVLPAPASPAESTVTVVAAEAGQAVAEATVPAFDPWPVLVALWLAGAAVFLAWRMGGYFLLRRRTLRGAELIERRGAIRVIESDAVTVPVAFGVLDKVVALPIAFARSGDAQARDLAIAHELEHHAGRDIAVNFAMQPLLALHWFNPLAWAGWRALRRDQEAACDARVLAGRDAQTRQAYARLIADFARGPNLGLANPMACAVLAEKNIVYRLRSLTMTEPTPRRRLAGRLMIAAGVLALPLTASISYAASDDPAVSPPPAAKGAPVKSENHIVIIEKDGGADPSDPKLKTRVVTKDGKTIVFKTDKDLSDAEIEKRVEKAMASMPQMPEMPEMPEMPAMAAMSGEPGQHRIVIRRIGPGAGTDAVMVDAETVDMVGCKNGEASQVDEQRSADGKHHRIKIKMCAAEHARAAAAHARAAAQAEVAAVDAKAVALEARTASLQAKAAAVEAIRSAREEVARDKGIPDDVRAKVLKSLDAEIARAEKDKG